jgi:hypothetical protein
MKLIRSASALLAGQAHRGLQAVRDPVPLWDSLHHTTGGEQLVSRAPHGTWDYTQRKTALTAE